MPQLKRCSEKADFKNVVTVLSSGNFVFDTSTSSISSLEEKIEAAIKKHLGREFMTIVRPVAVH